jgi:hypothetical protein
MDVQTVSQERNRPWLQRRLRKTFQKTFREQRDTPEGSFQPYSSTQPHDDWTESASKRLTKGNCETE